MFKIIKTKTYENLEEQVKKYKSIAKYQKDKNRSCFENYNAIVHLASKKSPNALKKLIKLSIDKLKEKYPEQNIQDINLYSESNGSSGTSSAYTSEPSITENGF